MSSETVEHYIRQPAVAGQSGFYPSDPARLREMIQSCLDEAEVVSESPIFGLIAPHAGYYYSGPVAGWAYKQILGLSFETVIIIAPSHFESFPYAAVMPKGEYLTPFGELKVNQQLSQLISETENGNNVKLSLSGHRSEGIGKSEHSLEVQLPFLQLVLGEFTIVPIVIGMSGWEIASSLGKAIAEVVKDQDALIVASTDLSHFHSYDEAYRRDTELIECLKEMDAFRMAEECRRYKLEACGGAPMAALLSAAKALSVREVNILKHQTSGDIEGAASDQVVGYLAASLHYNVDQRNRVDADIAQDAEGDESSNTTANIQKLGKMKTGLTAEDRRTLLKIAEDSVRLACGDVDREIFNQDSITEVLCEKHGLFVTIRSHGSLRGCIGHIESDDPMYKAVSKIAVSAAFHDPRFKPVSKRELDKLEFEISVLSRFIEVDAPEKIIPGEHGVTIEGDGLYGILLPQVATEQGWDRETLLENVCMKAGLDPHSWQRDDVMLKIFTAEHFSSRLLENNKSS